MTEKQLSIVEQARKESEKKEACAFLDWTGRKLYAPLFNPDMETIKCWYKKYDEYTVQFTTSELYDKFKQENP